MRWLLPVVACLALVQLSGCAERSFEPIESADWKPGYLWGYTGSATLRADSTFTEDGKVVEEEHVDEGGDDVAQWAYRVLSTELKHDGKPLYLVAMDGDQYYAYADTTGYSTAHSTGMPSLMAFRQDTLQPVGVFYNGCDRCPVALDEEAGSLHFYDVGSYPWIKFPLKHLATWSEKMGDHDFGGGEIESNVRGMVTVEGPAGKVDVVRITHTLRQEGIDEMREEILAMAEKEGIKVNAFEVSQSMTVELLYAPSLHNVVLSNTQVSASMHVDFEQDGHHRVGDMQMTGTATSRLVSYDLTEGPQVEVKDIGKALEVPIELPAVPGQEPTGTLRITADASVVNAAEKPAVRFTTKTTGNATAESYTVYDANDEAIAAGAGGDFTFKVKEPGTYKATVEGTDGNGRALRSSTEVIADYQVTLPANCGPANVLGFPNCDSIEVPVRQGIQWLEVKATRTPLAVEPGYGSLQLYDGGSYQSVGMNGNEATITIDSFEDRMLGEDWELQYYPYAGVMEDVEYTVTLMHSAAGPGSGSGSFFASLVEDAKAGLTPGLFGLPA